MGRSRTFYAKRNIAFGMLNKIITVFLPFVIRTIILYRLGAEYLGLNSLFTAILQAFNMAELGFSSAIIYKLYKPMSERDTDKICALLALYRKIYHVIGTIILIVGLLIMPFIKYLIKGTYPREINIYSLYLLFLFGTVISYFGVAYKNSLLSVAQRQDIISNIDSILSIIKSLIQVVMLIFRRDYYAYIIWNPLFILLNNIIVAYISKKLYPKYVCRGKIEKKELKEIITQVKGIAIGKVGLISRNSFDSIILSMFNGLIDVSIYSDYYFIHAAISSFLSVIVQSISGGIGNSLVSETVEKNYKDFKKFNYYFAWLNGWCTICLFCLYQPFMRFWAGVSLTAPYSTMVLFCVYFYIAQMGQIRSIYAGASGIWWEFRWIQIGEAVANPILNLILGRYLGMDGILIATVITVFLFSLIGITYVTYRECFKRSSKDYWKDSFWYGSVTIFAAIMTERVCLMIQIDGWIEIVLRTVICFVVPNILFFLISITDKRHRGYMINIKNSILCKS